MSQKLKLKPIKEQLDSLQFGSEGIDEDDIPIICGRIQFQLKNYENQLTNQLSYASNNQDQIQINQTNQNKFNFQINKSLQNHQKEKINLKSQKKIIKNHNYVEQILRQKYNLNQNNQNLSYQSEFNNSKQINKTELIEQNNALKYLTRPKFTRMFERPNILSKEQRNNPFYEPQLLSEKDFKRGLNYLLSKGVIPKDYDLTPAFEKGQPPIERFKLRLQPFEQKFDKNNQNSNKIKVKLNDQLQKNSFNNFQDDLFLTEQTNLKQIKINIDLSQKYSSMDKNNLLTIEDNKEQQIDCKNQLQPNLISKNIQENLKNYNLLIQQQIIQCNSNPKKLIIQNYEIDEKTVEFRIYKQIYFNQWSKIVNVINILKKILIEFGLQKVIIDGYKLGAISLLQQKLKTELVIQCLENQDLIRQILENPKLFFNVNKNKTQLRAVITIQKNFKFLKQKKIYKDIQDQQRSVQKLQMFLKLNRYLSIMREKKKNNIEKKIQKIQSLNEKLQKDWGLIKNQPRIEIHINSFGYDEFQRKSTEKIMVKKNQQISRIFNLKDTNLELIIIIPKEYSQDLINYYFRILELGNVRNYKERIHFVYPNIPSIFNYLSLIDQIYYDSFSLLKIKKLIQQKTAYLVPGYPCFTEIHLAHVLNVAIYSGNPKNKYLFSLKHGAKQVFQQCGIPTAPGPIEAIYDEVQLFDQLTKTLFSNQNIQQWRLKIINEFQGRGQAIFFFETQSYLQEIGKQQKDKKYLLQKLKDQIQKIFLLKLVVQNPTLFKNSKEFMKQFYKKGGIIEAQASQNYSKSVQISFLIEPNGETFLLGSFDKLNASNTSNRIGIFTQSQIKHLNYKKIIQPVSEFLYKNQVMGYISIDLVEFKEEKNLNDLIEENNQSQIINQSLFYAIDLNCYPNNFTNSIFYFDFLMNGQINQNNSIYSVKHEKKVYMVLPFLFHSALSQFNFQTFFQICSEENIHFNFKLRSGTTFSILDEFQESKLFTLIKNKFMKNNIIYYNLVCLGIMTVGNDHQQCIQQMYNILEFLNKYDSKNTQLINDAQLDRFDFQGFQDVLQCIRQLRKQMIQNEGLN